MRYFIIAVLQLGVLTAEIAEDEALSLRRIADFWEEGEYQIAKNQMETFLEEFPDSSYKSTLSSALGDLFLREKSYQTALNYYAQIQDPVLDQKIFLHRMQCLYHLEWHATLADECEVYLKKPDADPSHRLQATYLLAIALYSQALINHQNPETLTALAERAKPYFEYLATSNLSEEVAGAFAHLQCILKDYKSASNIYLDLAKKSLTPDEYLFQAALIQTKYDQSLALQTFDQLANSESSFAKEATYNMLVLYFEQGLYEKIVADKEKFAQSIPLEKQGLASLFVGQSYLHLKKYSEAAFELSAFLDSNISQDRIRPALLFLVEAAYQAQDLNLLDQAIDRLDRDDSEMPKALFCRAYVLKKQENFLEAKEQLQALLAKNSSFPERPQALLELAHLYFLVQEWGSCRQSAAALLQELPTHELVGSTWRLLLSASLELKDKVQFIADLEQMLEEESFLSTAERGDWTFHLAKAYFEIGKPEKTMELLVPTFEAPSFPEHGNAELLFAFCVRDTQQDEENFQHWGERALASRATLLSLGQQHVALFNSYIKQNKNELAADHLYAALMEDAALQPANVFWLANYFYTRYEKESSFANVACEVLSRLPSASPQELETFHLKLAKLHRGAGRIEEAIAILERLNTQYRTFADTPWISEKETKVSLGELYLASGAGANAEQLFDELASSDRYRDRFTAAAALQSVRLKMPFKDDAAFEKGVTCLKNLILQKKLEQEPLHLEAALDYIDLLSQRDPAKKLPLLQKIKADFESQNDLLSKDYHAARANFPEQDKIYLDYMQYLEAAIQSQEKALHTKAKEILLQIRNEAKDPLFSRVESLLKNS